MILLLDKSIDNIMIKTIPFIVSSLVFIQLGCTSRVIAPKRPSSIPREAIWFREDKQWVYKDEDKVFIIWYPNGFKEQQWIKIQGGKTTWVISWYENGNKRLEGIIRNNNQIEIGKWTFWYANGSIKARGEFVEGKKNGLWEVFDERGKKIGEAIYNNGVLVSEKEINGK